MLHAVARASFVLVISAAAAEARPCRPGEAPRITHAGSPSCEAGERLSPYDPDTPRAGRQPGFIDLGNGTEMRIGGRVQMDYDTRRR